MANIHLSNEDFVLLTNALNALTEAMGRAAVVVRQEQEREQEKEALFRILNTKVTELEFPVRALNVMRYNDIIYVGNLVQQSEPELLRSPNFGLKSLSDVKKVLSWYGLILDMDVSDWTPPEAGV